MKANNREFFGCMCHNLDHLLVVTLEDDDTLSVAYRMNHYLGLFDRIKVAVKYVLNVESRNDESYCSHWDTVLLQKEDVERLRGLCDQT
jgi:hypothetical protein